MTFNARGGLRASLFFPLLLLALLVLRSSPSFAASPLAGYNPARLGEEGSSLFAEATSFGGDTALPLKGILDDTWNGRFTRHEDGIGDLYWNMAAGATYRGVRVAAINRGEMFISANGDSQEFFYRTKRHLDLPTGREYRIDVSIKGFIADGLELSYGHTLDAFLPGLSAGATVRVLRPRTLQDGTIKGSVSPTGPKSYDFDLDLDYHYGRNIVYKRKDSHLGSGIGYSADLGVAYRRGPWFGEAVVRDLVGEIIWDTAPFTRAQAISRNPVTSPDGYQTFSPTISGYEAQERYHQRIPLKTDLTGGYRGERSDGTASLTLIDGEPHYWLEAGYRPGRASRVSLGYSVEYGALQVGVEWHNLRVSVIADTVVPDEAKALGAQVGYSFRW